MPRGAQRIDPDIPQRAAAELSLVADVVGGEPRNRERGLKRAGLADRPVAEQLPYSRVLRVVDEHHVLHQHTPLGTGEREQFRGIRSAHGEWLLGKYVLACFQRGTRQGACSAAGSGTYTAAMSSRASRPA